MWDSFAKQPIGTIYEGLLCPLLIKDDRLCGLEFFSLLDGESGYQHIGLLLKHKRNTVSPLWVTLTLRIAYGLAEIPAHFQQLIIKVLKVLDFTFGYLSKY